MQQHCGHDVLIYRYLPHGSRNILDCVPLENFEHTTFLERFEKMYVFFHDQEPLDLDNFPNIAGQQIAVPVNPYRMVANNFLNRYDKVIVVHSELNSQPVTWFANNGAVPVYWWNHALLALDWYRYAQVDPLLRRSKQPVKDFLIYNRAWQGTREYRLKFSELVVTNKLTDHCVTTFNAVDGQHYTKYQFTNPALALRCNDLEMHFATNKIASTASADYHSDDYLTSRIEVVLETLYDDERWHLTEKTCRPIACAQPFILMSTPGSLEYLRRYGFRTFAPYIDETYDTIADPMQRMQAVIKVMQQISQLLESDKNTLSTQLQNIADYNRQRFFSQDFFRQVVNEFKHNFNQAAAEMKQHQSATYFKHMVKNASQGMVLPASREEIDEMARRLSTPVL